jgi:hypothetical protein
MAERKRQRATSSKPESPSSSSASASAGFPTTPLHQQEDSKQSAASGLLYSLVIRSQPTHVFAEETFEVDFVLAEAKKTTSSPPTNVEIRATLTKDSTDAASLVVVQEPRLSATRQTGKLVARILLPGSTTEKNSFRIQFDTKGDGIQGVATSVMHVVQAKLAVTTSSDWNKVWFKDEGGRDKCMEVTVNVRDSKNRPYAAPGPLQIILCYDAKPAVTTSATTAATVPDVPVVPVMNQDILRLLGSARNMELDAEGQAKIRFRIEDVSKNHQGQNFVLSIRHKHAAPCLTPPVSVRSKRNKRQRATPVPAGSAAAAEPQRSEDDRLREAVQGIVRWSVEVVNGIYPLQWQVMGYAQHPDGSLDYSRPYHNMQNPNGVISRMLSIYNESTRDQLEVLRSAFDQQQHHPPAYAEQYPVYGGMYPQHHARRGFTYESSSPHFAGPRDAAASASPHFAGPRDAAASASPHFAGPREAPASPDFAGPREASAAASPPPPPPHFESPPVPRDYLQNTSHTKSTPPDDENDESKVEYVLAKQYKSFQTGEPLGFPAYSVQKEILGFFRESGVGVRDFCSIRRYSFGPKELRQATDILQDAMNQKSMAVHTLKDWGSLASLLDHALVYDWSKDIDK